MDIKYSLLMPYIDRLEQFKKTLESLERYKRKDFEIVLAIDVKNRDAIQEVKSKVFVRKVITGSKGCFNPASLFNTAASLARGKYFIVTNPECRHETDILAGLDEEFAKNPDAYVVCGCESLKKDGQHHMWYQHSVHRNACYHFCTTLSAENYRKVGGFDENYADGVGYDDDDFREAVRGLPFVLRDDLLTVHQWHAKDRPHDYKERLARNKALFEAKWNL